MGKGSTQHLHVKHHKHIYTYNQKLHMNILLRCGNREDIIS